MNSENKYYNFHLYKHIRDKQGWDNWDMVLIDKHECENRHEALKTEREYIDKLNPLLNQMKPFQQKMKRNIRNNYGRIKTIKDYVKNILKDLKNMIGKNG